LDPGEIGTENNFGELAPASLSGFVFEDSDNDGNRDGNEDGIKKVDIVLTGIDDRGSAVNRSATTNNSGEYTFDNLRPGVYQMNEVQPADFADGKDSLGTLGGTTQNDQFSNIVVFPGQHGAGYNFGELLKLPQLSDEHTFRIFPDTEQRIHIRLLSRPGFDPGDIDLDTVRLGNAPWRKFRRGSDLNGDGRRDVSLFFKANETGLVAGDKTVRLIGQFRNGGFFAADLDVETLKFTDVPIRRHPPRAN
jgi:hypothetical protein